MDTNIYLVFYFLLHIFTFFFVVDGGWSDWNNLTMCSTTCGAGFQEQQRICNNPNPMYDGANCIGSATQTVQCVYPICPGSYTFTIFTVTKIKRSPHGELKCP